MTRINLFVWSCYLNAVTSLLMVVFVLLAKPISKVKLYWSLMCLCVGIWSIGFGIMTAAPTQELGNLGNKILHLGAIFIPCFLFQTCLELIQKKYRSLLQVVYGIAIIFVYLNFSGTFLKVRPIMDFPYYPSALPPYLAFVVFFHALFIATLFILWRASMTAADRWHKKQLQWLFYGIGSGFLGGITTFPSAYDIHLFPYGNFFIPLYVFIVGYAMLRYQLLDFKLALRRFTLALAIYISLLIVVLPMLWIASKSLFPNVGFPALMALVLVASLIFSSGPIIYSYLTHRGFWLKSHLSAGLTHELKSPLAIIQSALDILKEEVVGGSIDRARVVDYINMIQNNTSRLDLFVKDLLAIAKTEEGVALTQKTEFDFSLVVKTLAQTYRPQASGKDLTIDEEITNPLIVHADEKKVTQVISNLLSNAVKFSDSGTITLHAEKMPNAVMFKITDQGRGIDKKYLPHVFDRFYQASPSSKGSGIGLTIAKAWVEAHGGKIWAESEGEGKGTTVTFTLPV